MLRTCIAATILGLTVGTVAGRAQDKIDFAKQIQPIFAENCSKCHGEKMASGKMRLHTAAGLKEKWDADKELIVAGDPEKSELYQRLMLPADDKKRMPKMADPLPKETIELIANWIKQGAVLPDVAAAPAAGANTPAADKPAEEKPTRAGTAGSIRGAAGSDRQADGGRRTSVAAVRG